jgi:hypothetical protein
MYEKKAVSMGVFIFLSDRKISGTIFANAGPVFGLIYVIIDIINQTS